jgi:hypothetical protein
VRGAGTSIKHRTTRNYRRTSPAHRLLLVEPHRSPVLARSGPGALGVVLCGSGSTRKPLSWRSRQVSRHSPELSSVCCIDSVVSAAVSQASDLGIPRQGHATRRSNRNEVGGLPTCFRERGGRFRFLKPPAAARWTTWPVASRPQRIERKPAVKPLGKAGVPGVPR